MGEQPRRHVDQERRAVAIAVLVGLDARDALTTAHVRQMATGLGVDARTVWRWIAEARSDPDRHGSGHADRFEVTTDDITELAYWHGNAAAFHRARSGRLADPVFRLNGSSLSASGY